MLYTVNLYSDVCQLYLNNTGKIQFKKDFLENSLTVQCLGLCALTAGGPGLIPGQGNKN